jgi:ATP-dependent helicase/nuclease subunit B
MGGRAAFAADWARQSFGRGSGVPMRIVFDPDFDQGHWPGPLTAGRASAGEDWVGPARLVQVLEAALGLAGPSVSSRERAARLVPAVRAAEGFWSASASVDPFATARRLLEWRDALSIGGWRGGGASPRLAALSAVAAAAVAGLPDRLLAVNDALGRRDPEIESVRLFESRDDLEPLWQRTLRLLEQRGTRIDDTPLVPAGASAGSDLAGARTGRFVPKGDRSLRLLRASGPLEAAEEVAAWLASAGPSVGAVIIGGDAALDAALSRHGLPTTGVAFDQNDGALLQLLPLVLDLGWTPQDPQRAYQLLSLQASPVPGDIAWRLREALGQWPAVDSDAWREALAAGLAAIEDEGRRTRVTARLDVLWNAAISRAGGYPVAEVNRRAGMLRHWLLARAAVADTGAASWRAAAAQCEVLLGLVRHSALAELGAAQLRHLVVEATRSVEPDSPRSPQAGIHAVGRPGSLAGPARAVAWWRFDNLAAPPIPRVPLTVTERLDLESQGVALADPARLAAARARRWRRPLEQAVETLLLVCPERDVQGEELHPHPLWDEIVSRVGTKRPRQVAERTLVRPTMDDVVPRRERARLAVPSLRSQWSVPADRIPRRDRESPSSVERLLQCPFQWVLQYVARLRAPDSDQVDEGTSPRQLGGLLHAIMNRLFEGGSRGADEAALEAGLVFDREGPRLVAALFLPGSDADRERVRRAAIETARSLYGLMAAGSLTVLATEQDSVGRAFGTEFAGRVDLILGDPPRILDLKWGGAGYRRDSLKEGTAIQLAAYAFLERDANGTFPPVAYFVMETQRLFTTAPDAFPGAERVDGPPPEDTWHVLQKTYDAAWQAVQGGRVAAPGVEAPQRNGREKAGIRDGSLSMPSQCQWCDYTTLCGLAFAEEL